MPYGISIMGFCAKAMGRSELSGGRAGAWRGDEEKPLVAIYSSTGREEPATALPQHLHASGHSFFLCHDRKTEFYTLATGEYVWNKPSCVAKGG